MRILLTNDDGVHADGIFALKKALEHVGELFVVAPERPRSAAGHAITLHKPLRLNKVQMRDGSAAFGASGTPADCVVLGSQEVMGGDVDLVVSGINHGPNLGWDVHYSGTVAAAKEAAMTGHPAIAISLADYSKDVSYDVAGEFVAKLIEWIKTHPIPERTILNVNVPNLPNEKISGVVVTMQGPRQYIDRYEKRTDPAGRDYFWLGGTLADNRAEEGTDVRAIADGKISITPLQLDLTAHALIPESGEGMEFVTVIGLTVRKGKGASRWTKTQYGPHHRLLRLLGQSLGGLFKSNSFFLQFGIGAYIVYTAYSTSEAFSMAAKKKSDSELVVAKPNFDPDDPRIQDIYADEAFTWIHQSEVSVTFGIHYGKVDGADAVKPTVRLHFTHDTFLLLSDLFSTRAAMLREVYNDHRPSFGGYDESIVTNAFNKLKMGQQDVTK